MSSHIRDTTLDCQKNDKDLRKKISVLLVQDGWGSASAKQVAAFDPYNQNASADFFDPEWMFGIPNGFDICMSNPPYGANIDDFIALFEHLYPNTTKEFKDIYKLFIEVGLIKLLSERGLICYITPNTLLRQPRYKDVRSFLNRYKVLQILDLGLGVFEQVVPTCVFLAQKVHSSVNTTNYFDLTVQSHFVGDLGSQKPLTVPQGQLLDLTYLSFGIPMNKSNNELFLSLEDVLDLKDAGINYQRVNVGLNEKGKSDLGQRLLYEDKQESSEDIEYWKGEDINKYYISPETGRFVRISTIRSLRNNERVILNRQYFARTPKLLWRQTAAHLIATLDEKGVWFGRSVQGATIKPKFSYLDYHFLLGILNSSYLRYVYNRRVQEQGRVFPQIKFENIKSLPIPIVQNLKLQAPIVEIVNHILATKLTDSSAQTSELEVDIDRLVYHLYGLTPEEIAIVEGS